MKRIDISDLNISQIMAFLSVAETLNMTKSAENLCVTQPAISKRISLLEQQYGIILFIRDKNSLKLTPAGAQLYEDLKKSFDSIESSFVRAYEIQKAKTRKLTFSISSYFDVPLLYEIIDRFKLKFPDVDVDISLNTKRSQLLSGDVDIAFVQEEGLSDISSVSYKHVVSWQFHALVNKKHPLAQRDKLEIKDLLAEPLIVNSPQTGSLYLSIIEKLFAPYGKKTLISKFLPNSPYHYFVLLNKGIAIANPRFWEVYNKRTADYVQSRIKSFRLEGAVMDMCFAWLTEKEDKYIRGFLETFDEVISEGDNAKILDASFNSPNGI